MKIIILLLVSLPMFAELSNKFRITNWNGTGSGTTRGTASSLQTARPITLHRVFAQGEISDYPKPRVGGVVPIPWQSDVHSRWRDAFVSRSCSTAALHAASGQVQMTCSGHGFQNLETVVISGISGLNGTYLAVEPTTNTFILRAKNLRGAVHTNWGNCSWAGLWIGESRAYLFQFAHQRQ